METKKTNQGAEPNVLQRAAIKQAQFTAQMADFGYKTFTTFYGDLTIAEHYGPDAVRETFERVNESWRHDYKYYTEFIMALNHKIWEHYQRNDTLAALYDELWKQADQWAGDNWDGEAAAYYYQTTD